MKHLGNVRSKDAALRQARKIAKAENRPVVVEKAMCKNDEGKRRVCWRGFLDSRGEYTGHKKAEVWVLTRKGKKKTFTRDKQEIL